MAASDPPGQEPTASTEPKSEGVKLYKIGVWVSGIWIFLIFAAWITRAFKWPPFSDVQSSLDINAIGDALAGFFAPLAFLWLFIATWMQREELELQRAELSETRKVLAEQGAQLEKTAEENVQQTKIMADTLSNARSKDIYEQFSLRLLYLSKNMWRRRAQSGVRYISNSDGQMRTILLVQNDNLGSVNENADADLVLESFQQKIFAFNTLSRDYKDIIYMPMYFTLILKELTKIAEEEIYNDNDLIKSRFTGLGLDKILIDIKYLLETYPIEEEEEEEEE